MPVKLLGGDRQLGGALSWAEPAGVAQFTASSPFAGLTRAGRGEGEPAGAGGAFGGSGRPYLGRAGRRHAAGDAGHARGGSRSCCSMSRPTPTGPTCRCRACSWTCCGGWSRCRRAWRRSADTSVLAPAETLDGFGLLSAPPQAATGLPADEIARTAASPRHPPGLYGPENGRRALNLGANLPVPEAAPPVPGARIENYAAAVPERALGPALLALRGGAAGARSADRARPARAAAAEPGRGGGAAARAAGRRRRRRRSRAIPTRRWPRGSATS